MLPRTSSQTKVCRSGHELHEALQAGILGIRMEMISISNIRRLCCMRCACRLIMRGKKPEGTFYCAVHPAPGEELEPAIDWLDAVPCMALARGQDS